VVPLGVLDVFRRWVVVKGWYTYCMSPASYDPSAWGNGGPGAWHREHSATARGPNSLLGSLPEFSNLPQWLVSFSGPSKAKGGITRELLDDMGGGSAPMHCPFLWDPLSQTQVSGRPGW
jgi:hypothetical protein